MRAISDHAADVVKHSGKKEPRQSDQYAVQLFR